MVRMKFSIPSKKTAKEGEIVLFGSSHFLCGTIRMETDKEELRILVNAANKYWNLIIL